MTVTATQPPHDARPLLERLEVIWMTTVSPDGQPQASPVWFLFDGTAFTMYSRPDAPRMRNIDRNPRVALSLADDRGPGAISVEAMAEVVDGPPATSNGAFMSKYLAALKRMGATPEWFSTEFSVETRMTPTRWRVEDVS
jgi:PPOX class probable F420-dependent enzyme